ARPGRVRRTSQQARGDVPRQLREVRFRRRSDPRRGPALTVSFEVIRDPLWNNIRVDPLAMRLVDTRAFQRLRYVRQLGLAYLVYPGASHSRFEHALGAYNLARRALGLLEERGLTEQLEHNAALITRCAALLHDIGHYPF